MKTLALESVRDQALALGPAERAVLIDDLLGSFDPESREAIDAAIATEVEDRVDAYNRGEFGSISLEESRRQLGLG